MGVRRPCEVVAIDGPSGAGKSTVAREVARRLEYVYLDTGAMYRAVTLHFLRRRVALEDRAAVALALGEISIDLDTEDRVLLNGEDVTSEIRSRAVTSRVSAVSALPAVRRAMVSLQRTIARRCHGVVAEGRDTTTVVFPRAVKFYLDADLAERARRRAADFRARGEGIPLDRLEEEIAIRDRSDASRRVSPLRRAKDAVGIDTTDMPAWAVVQRVLDFVGSRRRAPAAAKRVRTVRRTPPRKGR